MRCRPEIRNRSDGEGMSKDNVVVGFVGLGTMGGRMAANVQRAGFKLVVHDLHRQAASHHLSAGAIWADSPRALAREAETPATTLPGGVGFLGGGSKMPRSLARLHPIPFGCGGQKKQGAFSGGSRITH